MSRCELCGWRGTNRRRKPDHCLRCLWIKEMFRAGMSVVEIGKRLGMPVDDVRHVVRRLDWKRPIATCPVCGLQGRLEKHTPSACARKLLVRSFCKAGVSASAIARKLGVSTNLVYLTIHRLGIKRSRPKSRFIRYAGGGE